MGGKLLKIAQSKCFAQILLLLILLVMGVVLSFLSPYFLTWSNFYNILDQTSVDIILAIGMVFVIASGGIDLSIGSVLAYSGIMMAFAMKAGIPVPLAVSLGIFAGVVIGLCSGLLISCLRLNPLVTTSSAFTSPARLSAGSFSPPQPISVNRHKTNNKPNSSKPFFFISFLLLP
jgi:ribose/xylose/arabinose/galactoside ABC-type transport system permease subunit